MARPAKTKKSDSATANLGFESKLWLAADKLRNDMDAVAYKLACGEWDYAGANPEDPDEYRAEHVFWVPQDARWSFLQANAKQPTIGKVVDDAMVALERDNPRLKGVLPKDYDPQADDLTDSSLRATSE
ncbi:MAG: Type restriction enzyme EcoKI protein [Verrucomicrobiota bacterium]|jgi:type I restriction enzyme M protein